MVFDNVQFQKISTPPPTEGIRISCGVGGSVRPKKLKKCMKLNLNFQRSGGFEKIPSVGEVWIFSEITQLNLKEKPQKLAEMQACENPGQATL